MMGFIQKMQEEASDDGKLSLYERGKQFLSLKEDKINREREKREAKGSGECSFQPVISKKAKSLVREGNAYEFNSKWVSTSFLLI